VTIQGEFDVYGRATIEVSANQYLDPKLSIYRIVEFERAGWHLPNTEYPNFTKFLTKDKSSRENIAREFIDVLDKILYLNLDTLKLIAT